jgi:hypothetical protein
MTGTTGLLCNQHHFKTRPHGTRIPEAYLRDIEVSLYMLGIFASKKFIRRFKRWPLGYANDVTSPICFSPLPTCFLKFFENVGSPRKPPHALVRKLDSR